MQTRTIAAGGHVAADLSFQLKNLQVFLQVAANDSIAQAAKLLFKAPSAVTRSIAELEQALGVKLFERNSRGVLLNAYGQLVLVRALRIDEELAQAAVELSRPRGRPVQHSNGALMHLLYNGRKLKLLIHLADSRKISTAAAHLGITQSGASMALARIESVVGEPLFHRGVQGMMATDAAHKLVVRAKRVFAELRHMVSELASASGSLAGSVVVGILPVGRTYIFPMAVASVAMQFPQIRTTTVDSPFERLMSDLRTGDVDAIVGVPREGEQNQDLAIEPLFTDRLAVIARAGHPLAAADALTLADILGAAWILPWTASPSRALFDHCFREASLRPPVPIVESADLAIVRQLLCVSDMIGLASARQFRLELRAGLLVELPIVLPGMTREISLITREGVRLSPAVLAVLNAIRQQVAEDMDDSDAETS
ncbi:MAG: hypothetical protein ABS76_01985 [Pelagibacterium sp. SCN 64-44]|mgnify:CR=1 FL=1|nr:MAG: hypothetical protein ABS76_01985 [Pelagibacterium sp. SCN 64-44]